VDPKRTARGCGLKLAGLLVDALVSADEVPRPLEALLARV